MLESIRLEITAEPTSFQKHQETLRNALLCDDCPKWVYEMMVWRKNNYALFSKYVDQNVFDLFHPDILKTGSLNWFERYSASELVIRDALTRHGLQVLENPNFKPELIVEAHPYLQAYYQKTPRTCQKRLLVHADAAVRYRAARFLPLEFLPALGHDTNELVAITAAGRSQYRGFKKHPSELVRAVVELEGLQPCSVETFWEMSAFQASELQSCGDEFQTTLTLHLGAQVIAQLEFNRDERDRASTQYLAAAQAMRLSNEQLNLRKTAMLRIEDRHCTDLDAQMRSFLLFLGVDRVLGSYRFDSDENELEYLSFYANDKQLGPDELLDRAVNIAFFDPDEFGMDRSQVWYSVVDGHGSFSYDVETDTHTYTDLS